MQFPSKTQLIEDNSHSSEWNGDIFGVKKEDEFLGKVFRQAQEVTEANEPLPEGLWRTNQFIEDNSLNGPEECLAFQHITSFEENIMESHGKKMREIFEKFLESVNSRFCPEDDHKNEKKAKILDEEEFEEAIFSVSNLNEEIKKSLLRQSKKSIEAQHIIKNLLEELCEEHLVEALTICENIIGEHEAANIFALDEDEIQAFVEKHETETTNIIRGKLVGSWMISKSKEDEKDLQRLVGSWMSTVFYALNGVYEDESEKSSTLKVEVCQKPRKMVKLD